MSRGAIMRDFLEKQKKKREEEERFAPPTYKRTTVGQTSSYKPTDTAYVPIVKQLEDMLAEKRYRGMTIPQAYPEHIVQPEETLSGIAQQHLQSGARWPEIRDLNIPVLQEGLSRFAPDDPRRQRELGHWIFPEQTLQLPMEAAQAPELTPPSGLQEELQAILQRKYSPSQMRHGLGEPALGRSPKKEPLEEPELDLSLQNILTGRTKDMGGALAEPEAPSIHPRQRGVGWELSKYELPGASSKEKTKPDEAQDVDIDKLVTEYIDWNYTRKGKTPTEENIRVAAKKVSTHPEMYSKGFAQEAPKTTWGKIGNFLNRVSEAGADAFTLSEGEMPKATTGNTTADGIADTIGSLMGFLHPGGPVQALTYASQVLWNIAPRLSKVLKVPTNLVYRSLSAGTGLAAIGGYKSDTIKEMPKEMLKGGIAGAFMGASEHIAGPMINSITRKLGIPVESTTEKLLEAIHTQGTTFSTLSAGYSILEGKSAEEVAQDALTGYMLGGLFGGLSYGYSRVTTKIVTDKGKTLRVKEFMKIVEEQGLSPQYDAKGKHTGYWMTSDGKQVFGLTVSYKGKSYHLGELIDRPILEKAMSFDFGELPRGIEPIGISRTPYTSPRYEGHIPQGASRATADFYAHPEFGTIPTDPGAKGGASRTRVTKEPLGLLASAKGKTPVSAEGTAGKMPQHAYDLVVRTKSPPKKQYGRELIGWLEGGEKPVVPQGLSEAEARDIETKLTRMAERAGVTTSLGAKPPGLTTTAPPVPTTDEEKIAQGIKPMIESERLAGDYFVENVMEQFGFSKEEAEIILQAYQKAKVVKLDRINGRFDLKHGSFWERAPMEEALRQAGKLPGIKGEKPKAPAPLTTLSQKDIVDVGRHIEDRLNGIGVGIEDIYFVGSRIKGTAKPTSDVDVIVIPKDKNLWSNAKEYTAFMKKAITAVGNHKDWDIDLQIHKEFEPELKGVTSEEIYDYYGVTGLWGTYRGALAETGTEPASPAKEPWQIPLQEFVKQQMESDLEESQAIEYIEERIEFGDSIEEIAADLSMPVEEVNRLWKENISDEHADIDEYTPGEQHRAIIEQALSEGKPVPPEVLKDYPELAGKAILPAIERRPAEVRHTAAKEPWQMTKDELRYFENKPKYDAIVNFIKSGKPVQLVTHLRGTILNKPEHIRITDEGEIQIPEGRRWVTLLDDQIDKLAAQVGMEPSGFAGKRIYHKAEVEKAVKQGKPVPQPILEEYKGEPWADKALAKMGKPAEMKAEPDFPDYLQPAINKMLDNPHVEGVSCTYVEDLQVSTMGRKELDRLGYSQYPEGAYARTGTFTRLSDGTRKTVFYPGSSKDTVLEELVHVIQERLGEIDPDLARDMKNWESDVIAKARAEGGEIPKGYELFAKAYVYAEMGYAKQEPVLAERLSIPSHIKDRFDRLVGSSKTGADNLSFWKGEDFPETPREQRKLHVTTDRRAVVDLLERLVGLRDKPKDYRGFLSAYQKASSELQEAIVEKGEEKAIADLQAKIRDLENAQVPGEKKEPTGPGTEGEKFKPERLKDRQMEVVSRRGHSRPYGPQWEVQVTTLKDTETGKEYLWWSDRALSDFVPGLKAGDKVTLSATTRQGYGENDINLTHVKVERTFPVPNKPPGHDIRQVSKREGVRIEEHYDDKMTRVIFDKAPSEEVKRQLKGRGFKWNSTIKGWEKKIGENSAEHAEEVLDKYLKDEIAGEELTGIAKAQQVRRDKIQVTAPEGTKAPAPKTEEASPWKVTTNIIDGKRVYGVYRTIDPNEPDHSGNRDVIGYYDTREEAERIAKGEPEKPAETEKKEAKKELKPFKPLSKGNTVTAYTEKNDPIEVKYVLAEAGDLVTSHDTSLNVNPDYPEELQPRQRERAASEAQVHSIASRLNPARLGENPMITDGAPIIGPDGVVETGNGRTIAVKRVYKQNTEKAQEYRNWLIENADKFGLDRNTVEKAKEPVLVRARLTEVDRVVFTQEGNVSTVAEMSASEIAIQDAKKLTPKALSLFVPNEEGRIDSAANRSFISAFIGEVVPGSERGKLMDAKGQTLTQDGIRRIRNAIFARVYGNPLALEKLSEDTDVNVRNQINSMVNAAPKFLEIKEGIEKGDYFPLDITEDIAAAMVKLSDLRDTGMTVEGYLRQLSLFGEELTDIGKAVLNIFDKHKRSAKRITAILQEYAHGVELAGSPKQIQLYQTNPPTKDDVLAVAVKKVESLYEGQLTVFETQEVVHERTRTPGEEGTRAKTEREGGTKGGAQKAVGPAPKFQGTGKGSQAIPLTRRRNIVKFLSEKLDIPIRVGRFRQKAWGIFKQKPEVIRTRLAQDIPTISHEVGHYLDKKFGFSQDKTFDAELLDLGKRTSKPSYSKRQIRMEGVAEFMRLYLTNPQVLLKQAPQYYAAFESIMMANRDIHDVLLQARQDIHNWLNQPAKARVLGVISIGEKNTRKMSLERLYTAAVDELRPIQRYVKALFPEGVDFDKDPFLQAWLGRGWTGKAETLINYGIMDKDYNKVGPSLKEILQPIKGKIDDFRAYVTAKRAIELHDRGIEPGITRQDAEQTVKDLETPKFKKAQAQLVKFSDVLIDMLVDAEILDKPGADLFRAMNRSYVPFYRVFEEMGESHGYGKTGYANLGNPVKRMKGSQRDIVDPLESIIRNTFFLTNIAERNKVGLLVAELAESKEGSGKWVEMVSVPVRPVKVGLSEIKDALEGAGIDLEELDLDKAATIFRPSPFPAGKENILVIWREGQRRFYQLEPELYRALLALDKESANMLINLLSKPAALLRAGATLSPDFMVRNPIRDMWTAMIYSDYGYKPQDFMKGLFSVLKKDDLYWKFHASGAAHGAMVSLDRDYLQGALRNVLETSTREKVKNLLKNPLELFRALSEYGEMATRVGEFGRGLKAEGKTGKGIRKAALSARDVTLDFARWGYVGKVPNRVIAFFNANVQGMDKMARSFKNNPGRSILRSLLYITLPSIILYLLNRGDERYQELPQWEKDLFWIILTPKHVFRIPKPFEIGVIFGTLAERVLDYIYTEDPAAFKGYLNTVKEAGLPDILPTAFTGWIEAFYANKSFFTGRPIVPVGEERLSAEHQYGNYTSETAKLIGRLLKISPRKADHIAYSYGGGLARYGTKVLDQLIKAVGATEKVTKPASTLADYPVMGAFTSRVWSNSHSMDKFYNRLDEVEKIYSKAKTGVVLTEREKDKLARLKGYRSAATDMSQLRIQGQKVFESPVLTAQEKREMLDTINIIRINIARYAIGLKPIRAKP